MNTAPAKLQITAESFAALNKNPISAFMEYAQSRHLSASIDSVEQHGPSHKPVYVGVFVNIILCNKVAIP